jgi:CRP-like cAMP-binding protein
MAPDRASRGETGLSTSRYNWPIVVGQSSTNASDQAARRVLRELLGRLLPACRATTLTSLAQSARLHTLQPGDVIYPQGEPVPITIITEGFGVARRMTADGQEIMSGVAPSGVLFGYSGIASTQSSVAMTALTRCEVAQWLGSEWRRWIPIDPSLGLAAIDSMAASLHQTMQSIEGFLHQDARRRVMRVLSRHRQLFFSNPAVLTRAHLPGLVGTSPEMTRRVLRQLEAEGTLSREGSVGLRLLRPDRLEGEAP